MRYFKLSILFFLIGVAMLTLSSWAAKPLAESTRYSFPQSLLQHYNAKKQGFENAVPINTMKKLSADELTGIDTVFIETTAADITIERLVETEAPAGDLTATFQTPGQTSDDPLSVIRDGTRAALIRTAEAESNAHSTWMTFSLGENVQSSLTIRLPASIKTLRVRTISGDFHFESSNHKSGPGHSNGALRFGHAPLALELESKSGDFAIDTHSPEDFEGIRVTTVSGDFTATDVQNVDYKSVSGDCLLLYRKHPSARVNFHSTSGEFKLSMKDEVAISEPNHKLTLGQGKGLIEVNTVSGDLTVQQRSSELDNRTDSRSHDLEEE